ncbi:MAG: TonB-dependent receptor [Bacteroidales bacterium]|nr:TonB-dependent receptor [Bacteroidales bacterium]
MKRIVAIVAILLAMVSTVVGQEYITLHGLVSDKQSRQPVPYTAILLQGTSTGTQANDRGEFALKVSSVEGTVVFSAMGYKKATVSVKQLRKSGIVRLEPHLLQLQEVTIKDYRTPQALIAEAVRRLPDNYHTDTTIGTWFARDWRMLDTTLYLFDESVVDMLRFGYNTHSNKRYYTNTNRKREMDDNYKVVRKHRLLIYDSIPLRMANADSDNASKELQYNDNSTFYDILATPDANYLTAPRLVKRHKFDPIQEYTDDQGVAYYKLSATNKDGVTHYVWHIRKSDLAIVELSAYSDSSTNSIRPRMWSIVPWSAVHNNGDRAVYRYAERNGKMTLVYFAAYQDVTYTSHQMYGHEHDAPVQHYTISRQWLLTDLQQGDTTFLLHNKVQSHKPVGMDTAFGQSTYDETYWEQYNTLPLDANIQTRLQRQLSAQSPDNSDVSTVATPITSTANLDSITTLRASTPMTMPSLPRWTFFRYVGIGGDRLYCSDDKSRRGFCQQLGVGTRLYLGGRFHLRADLQYAWLTTKTNAGRFSTHNLTLPLSVDFDLLREAPDTPMRIYMNVGVWGRYALVGRLDNDWHTLGHDYDRTDYGWSWGLGMEVSRSLFIEWNSFRSIHPLPLDKTAPPTRMHNGAFTIGINF